MKICSRCNLEKDKLDFSIIKNRGTVCARCDTCVSEVRKRYRESNVEKIKEQRCIYYLKNREIVTRYYEKNEDKIKKNRKKYIEENRVKIREKDRCRDPVKRKKSQKDLYDRRKNEPMFLLRSRIGSVVNRALKRNKSSKNGESCTKYLPYTFEKLKSHLELLFEEWMNWDNWGVYDPKTWDDNDKSTWRWQIDHIIPHSSFKYTSMGDEEFKKCWELSNLRPYSAKQNILDGTRRIRHV